MTGNNDGYSHHCKIFSHEGSLGLNKFESQTSLTSFHNLALVSNEAPEFCVLLSRTTYWGESLCCSLCFDRIVGRYTSYRNVHEPTYAVILSGKVI